MNSQHVQIEGGCLCGAVRYHSKKPPIRGFYCHCTVCQKNYGGLFQATLQFRGSDFEITQGSPKYYRASEFARRGFCAQCGSPLLFTYEGNPDVWVLIGSLDHLEDWPLTKDASWGEIAHVHVDAKVRGMSLMMGCRDCLAKQPPFETMQ
jgi:hypothetical protein